MKDTPMLGEFEVVEEPKKTPEKKPKQKPEEPKEPVEVVQPQEPEPKKEPEPIPADTSTVKELTPIESGLMDPGVASFVPATLEEKLFSSGNLDMLERYIEMRNKDEERNAKKEFDKHFAEMQGNFTIVDRGTKGAKADYATFEEILEVNGKVISDHGFSFRFRKTPLSDPKGWTRFTIIISGHGHTDENTFIDLPPFDEEERKAMRAMGKIQAVLAVETYAKRATLVAGFGIATKDKDLDSGDVVIAVRLAEEILILKSAQTKELVTTEYNRLGKILYGKKDMEGVNYLRAVRDARLEELGGENGTTK